MSMANLIEMPGGPEPIASGSGSGSGSNLKRPREDGEDSEGMQDTEEESHAVEREKDSGTQDAAPPYKKFKVIQSRWSYPQTNS
jgi:hypothetical protein